ncbi:Transthyretin-like family protein [Ancylostoma duodenale]|uniref:Transthyretin-like family protein n=1 Tax=Ancylostoma duodenale TaxID=51022 RepID=A0A0C2H049_9BILA|nr:Transthyretin-like family protein [Ancylostoma duodenale]
MSKSLEFVDQVLAQGFSNSEGVFYLTGRKGELSSIDPKVYILHRCNYDGNFTDSCYKKLSFEVPKNFVTKGSTPTKVFNIGHIKLAGEFSEDTSCIK